MRDHEGIAVLAHQCGRKILLGVFCGLALAACAHPMAPLRNDRTVVISGKRTAGDSSREASQKMLIQAARLTLDHGCRYFTIVDPPLANSIRDGSLSLQPGANLTIKVYREGEIDPRNPNVWDAASVAAGNL